MQRPTLCISSVNEEKTKIGQLMLKMLLNDYLRKHLWAYLGYDIL
jgi:hypothetical protein